MKKKSTPAADSKGRVGELQRRAQDARKRAESAKKEAQDAKQRAREARRLFKEAKKVAKKARNELAALSKKLKKLIDDQPRARSRAGATMAAPAIAKSSKAKSPSKRKAASPKAKSAKRPKAKTSTTSESSVVESQPATPRRSRSSRRPVANESVEAVVDPTGAGEAPARTSEETVIEPEGQNTPEESPA